MELLPAELLADDPESLFDEPPLEPVEDSLFSDVEVLDPSLLLLSDELLAPPPPLPEERVPAEARLSFL